jgi:hypothetical protein
MAKYHEIMANGINQWRQEMKENISMAINNLINKIKYGNNSEA